MTMNRVRLALFAVVVALGLLALVAAQDASKDLAQSTASTFAAIEAAE